MSGVDRCNARAAFKTHFLLKLFSWYTIMSYYFLSNSEITFTGGIINTFTHIKTTYFKKVSNRTVSTSYPCDINN